MQSSRKSSRTRHAPVEATSWSGVPYTVRCAKTRGSLDINSLSAQPPVQRSIHIVTGTDEQEMGKRLGEVPQGFTGRPDLLRIQSHVVRVGQHLLQYQASLLQTACTCQRLDQPEATDAKCSLLASKPIVCCQLRVVAIDMGVAGQLLLNTIYRLQHARIIRAGKPGERHEQGTGIDRLTPIVLHKTAHLLVPALFHDFLVDL